MAPHTMSEEYAELMKRQSEGRYLYKPQALRDLHPGAVGFFDPHGRWTTIADLTAPPEPSAGAGLTPSPQRLQLAAPVHEAWHIRTSSRDAERHFGLTAGLSGLLAAAAPVETSADADYTTGTTGHAALVVTAGPVTSRALRPPYLGPVQAWVRANAKTLLNPAAPGDGGAFAEEIRRYGLWVIAATWSARGCAVRLAAGVDRERKVGGEVGAPDLVGKVGAEVGWKKKLESEGWTTFAAEGEDEGKELVVSFGGIGFSRSVGRAFFGGPVLRSAEPITFSPTAPRPLYNSAGARIGTQYYRPTVSAAGTLEGQWISQLDNASAPKDQQQKAEEEEEEEEEAEENDSTLHLDPTLTTALPDSHTLATLATAPEERAFAEQASRAEVARIEARGAANRAFATRALGLETSVSARHERVARLRALLAEGEHQDGAWEALAGELWGREERRRRGGPGGEGEGPWGPVVETAGPEAAEVRALRFAEGDAEPVEVVPVPEGTGVEFK